MRTTVVRYLFLLYTLNTTPLWSLAAHWTVDTASGSATYPAIT